MQTEPFDCADLDAMLEFDRSRGWGLVQTRIRGELGRRRADLDGTGDVPRPRGEIKALILGCLSQVMVARAGTPNPDFYEKLERFHLHCDKFIRAYEGCPKGAAFIEECKPALGTFDWRSEEHAASAARPLFSSEKDK